jgi:hypothetical protein
MYSTVNYVQYCTYLPEDVHIRLSTDKTCALKVKRINYPASGPSRNGNEPMYVTVQYNIIYIE